MKKIKSRLTILLCVAMVMLSENIFAQNVGVNTLTPGAALEVKGFGNTAATKTMRIVNSSGIEILTMLDNGRLGIGQTAPAVRLDLRGNLPNPVVAIGTTAKSAMSVGGGSIRYMAGTKEIHYSDGVDWFRLKSSAIRPCVVAVNDYDRDSEYLTGQNTGFYGFKSVYDSHDDSFVEDPINGCYYTAPVDGLYVVSFTISFDRKYRIPNDSYVEGKWITDDGRVIRAVQAYPQGGSGQAGVTCKGTIRLSAGEVIRPKVWHNLGNNVKMRTYGYNTASPQSDVGFNYLSIFSQ